jgi:hypothetical protein
MKKAMFFFLLLFLYSYSFAQIPHTISYQGILTDNQGNTVPDGNISLTFRLYNTSEGGDTLWQETQNIMVRKGVFSVILGGETSLNLPFDEQYWLGITVGNEKELIPRTALTSSPYSLSAIATIVQPEAGQNLEIKKADGTITHTLDANGNAEHTGVSTFDGGVKIKAGADTSLVIMNNNGFIFLGPDIQPDTSVKMAKTEAGPNKITASIPQTRISATDIATPKLSSNQIISVASGGGIAVKGDAPNFGTGVEGTTKDGFGVSADATGSGTGIVSSSRGDGEAITATAFGSGDAIVGTALSSGVGIQGFSTNSYGGWFKSEKDIGIYANGLNMAALLDGDVEIKGKLKIDNVPAAANQQRFLVWGADNIVKYSSLPSAFDGILQDRAFVVKNGDTEVFRVDTNGNSYHKGVETFDDDVILNATNGKGIKLVNKDGLTLAGFGRKDLDTGQRLSVYGRAQNPGDLAGAFQGDVEVRGEIAATSFHIVGTNGDTLTDFYSDGTSRHKGLETYEAGLKVTNTDGSSAIELVPNTNPVTEYGLRVNGNVKVNGILNAQVIQAETKQFRIDDPLDPEHKYLNHTSVESSEMKNVYDGKVVLDRNGEADVSLPEWFQALNIDYRYQLTCIGGYAPVYIKEEIHNNRFKIAGGQKGLKVCWLVTGVRNDKFAREHRMKVITDK